MKRLAVLVFLALAAATPAAAGGVELTTHVARPARAQPCAVPLAQVLAMIARTTPGTHLDTDRGDFGGRPAYFVRWKTTDGRVIIFIVDADSGQILSRQGG
jgi:uncharacterized membrane protein YkoI